VIDINVITLITLFPVVTMNKPMYFPIFLDEPGTNLTSVKQEDWLMDELQQEIKSHYPESNGIIGDDHERCNESFQKHAFDLFPLGHNFASYVQLCAAVK
jgi:hypothetical protein